MRTLLATAALAAGLVAALPTAPASAMCTNLHVEGYECWSPCGPAGAAWKVADRAVKDALPDDAIQCVA
jgi:hypothetical protein